MDFTLNEEQTMIVDMVRKFVQQEIIPLEKDLDPDADEVDQGQPQSDRDRSERSGCPLIGGAEDDDQEECAKAVGFLVPVGPAC